MGNWNTVNQHTAYQHAKLSAKCQQYRPDKLKTMEILEINEDNGIGRLTPKLQKVRKYVHKEKCNHSHIDDACSRM